MNRNFGIGILILSFGLSSVNVSLATEVVNVSPIIVQPYDLRALNQQILEQDRINRDQELAIKGLMEDNQRLAETALAREHDATLEKINQTMINYRDFLLSRDRARIEANSQRVSKYHDLIKLTEDVDDMKDVQGMKGLKETLQLKSDVIEGKYKILTELKDEMTALNEKLKEEASHKDSNKIDHQQGDKIQILTQRLGEMDKRIAHFDEVLAEKDRQIAQLKDNLAKVQGDAAAKDETIKEQKKQIDILQGQSKDISSNKDQANQLGQQLSQKQGQLDLLKSELENKITQENNQNQEASSKDETIKQQENQIAALKAQSQELSSKEELIKSQADQMAKESELYKNQSTIYGNVQDELKALRSKMNEQAVDLKAKDESIQSLNEVVAAAQHKTEYFKLTAQKEHLSAQQVQEKLQQIKDDFAQRSKNDDQLENDITSFKDQVGRLSMQLSQKQQQVDLLKSELESKVTESNNKTQEQAGIQQDLKAQLQDKENQILKMKSDVLAILQDRANKEIYLHNVSVQLDNRVSLAKELIDLQQQEASLLDEKDNLALQQYDIFDRHFDAFENRMKTLLANRRFHDVDLRNQMDTLIAELNQKHQEVDSLKAQLEEKIAMEKNQGQLQMQMKDLRSQLQDKEGQITTMNTAIQSGQQTEAQAETLKQQLADEQNNVNLLKQELDNKNAQSNQMTVMMSDYQKKLEAKDNAYNEQSGQIADLSDRLQKKEAQLAQVKKDMSDLQESNGAKDRDLQAKDLSLSMMQQKVSDGKINDYQERMNRLEVANDVQEKEVASLKADLALARQELAGVPSSDEINFLRTGLKKASTELKEKDATLLQVKANADEYEKQFKAQSAQFQSLKEQLQGAYDEISRRNEDLKYKNLELVRFKELSTVKEGDLQDQVKALSVKLEAAQKKVMGKIHGNKSANLEEQLERANLQIKDLQAQLNGFILPAKKDTLREKLKQALDKIDEQGRMINVLAQKLQDAGQNVNLTQHSGK